MHYAHTLASLKSQQRQLSLSIEIARTTPCWACRQIRFIWEFAPKDIKGYENDIQGYIGYERDAYQG